MNISQQKQNLRKKLLEQRKSLSEESYLQKSVQICKRLTEQAEFKKAQTIHCYVSINKRREVNTHPLIKKMPEDRKRVVVPFMQIEKGTLLHIELNHYDDLKPNRWGVLEPQKGNEVDPKELDLVIVPMVGGDSHKNRIGYGKGFYDRFLQQPNCPKIGLLFEECLVEKVPVEGFDVGLDRIMTEDKVIE